MRNSGRALIVATLAVGLLGVVGGEAGATHEYIYTPTTTRFFMRNDAPGCPGTPFLSITAGSGEQSCGYVGGLPYGELSHTGAPVGSTVITYTARDGVPTYLDPTRDATGNVTVVATAQTSRMAVGQIIVVVTLKAKSDTGQTIVLGSHSSEALVNPTNSAETSFPFTMEMNDAFDKVRLDQVTVDVDIRGWHVLTGFHRLDGQSYLDLPAYVRTAKPHG